MQEAVITYVRELFAQEDKLLRGWPDEVERAGLPRIQVPPELGKLLSLLVRATDSRKVLEIGTLGGYSATWMARALPEDGRLITLEIEPKHAAFARDFLDRAGVGGKVEVLLGPALDSLPQLLASEGRSFDLVFIDANKEDYPAYLDWAVRLTRPGGLIIADNTLRGGTVLHPGDDPQLQGLAALNERMASSENLGAILLPVRGGEDGLTMAVVKADA